MRIPLEKLVQKGDKIFAEDNEGNSRLIAKLSSPNVRAFFENDGFYVVQGIPYTSFIYHKYYDEDGNYLAAPTEERFMLSLIREIETKLLCHDQLKSEDDAPNQMFDKREIADEIVELRNSPRLTYDVIERIIEVGSAAGLIDNISLASYRKAEKLLRAAGVEKDLELPIINICSLNESGEYGRRSLRFCSVKIDKMLWGMLRSMGKDSFKAALYDPIVFHKAVEDYIAR